MNVVWILIGAQSLAMASERRRRAALGGSPARREAGGEEGDEAGRAEEAHMAELSVADAVLGAA
jgi:hypothetical protein